MEKTQEALLKGLVHLIWADGEVTDDERELLGGVLANLGLSRDEVQEVAKMMIAPPELGDLKTAVPDQASRIEIMKVLVATALADGKVEISELHFLEKMADQLEIGEDDLGELTREVLAGIEIKS